MHGHEPSMARGINVGIRLYLHPFFVVCVGSEGSDKTACMRSYIEALALIDYTRSTNNLISWPIFTKKPSYY